MGATAFTKNQLGPETTAGTAVAATRQLVGTLLLTDAREREFRDDEQRGTAAGANVAQDLAYLTTAKYTGRLTSMELPYWLACALSGAVSPTTPAGTVRLWTHANPTTAYATPKSMTAYFGDDTQALRAAGVYAKKIKVKGGESKPLMIEVELFGRRQGTSTFAALTHPTTEDFKGLLTKWYWDAVAGTIGTTQKTGTFYEWEWTLDTGIEADYTQDGSLDMTGIHRIPPSTSLTWVAKWNSEMVTQFSNYDGLTQQLIRVENEGSTIETTYKHRVRFDGAYLITKFEPLSGVKNGTQLCKGEARSIDNATYAKRFEVTVQNTLTAIA